MPLVTTYQCDATTGDANKFADTYSRLQLVFNPEYGLISRIVQTCQDMWNTTRGMPIEERMDYAMATSCAMMAIVRHHLYMKTGSGCDRTFPDCMMTCVFDLANISDYHVTAAERFKRITLNGPCDADSHSPLMREGRQADRPTETHKLCCVLLGC